MYKRDFFWISVAGIINAAEAVIMSMIVTRVTSLSDAGILTIAFAVGNLFMTVGKFGVRNYRVTDVEMKYTYGTYMTMRIISVFAMLILSIGYFGMKNIIRGESIYCFGVSAVCFFISIK